jgi:hypothetical protein
VAGGGCLVWGAGRAMAGCGPGWEEGRGGAYGGVGGWRVRGWGGVWTARQAEQEGAAGLPQGVWGAGVCVISRGGLILRRGRVTAGETPAADRMVDAPSRVEHAAAAARTTPVVASERRSVKSSTSAGGAAEVSRECVFVCVGAGERCVGAVARVARLGRTTHVVVRGCGGRGRLGRRSAPSRVERDMLPRAEGDGGGWHLRGRPLGHWDRSRGGCAPGRVLIVRPGLGGRVRGAVWW